MIEYIPEVKAVVIMDHSRAAFMLNNTLNGCLRESMSHSPRHYPYDVIELPEGTEAIFFAKISHKLLNSEITTLLQSKKAAYKDYYLQTHVSFGKGNYAYYVPSRNALFVNELSLLQHYWNIDDYTFK